MLGRSASFRAENLGQNALRLIGNLCFALFVIGVLVFTVIAATYHPDDPSSCVFFRALRLASSSCVFFRSDRRRPERFPKVTSQSSFFRNLTRVNGFTFW